MSKLQELCTSVKVYNDYEFFGDQPYIDWCQSERRSVFPPWYAVCKRGVSFGDAWYAHGAKLFSYSGGAENKHKAFDKAAEFMKSEFGITSLKRSPFGGWGDMEYVTKRLKEIKALAKKGN